MPSGPQFSPGSGVAERIQIEPETVRFTVDFSLRKVKLPALRRRLTDEERESLVAAIMAHLDLCGWTVWRERREWHSTKCGVTRHEP